MNDNISQSTRTHNIVVTIITVACIGAIIECISQGWEYWVSLLIIGGVIATWYFHVTFYRTAYFRENFYLVFSMLVSFFHGVHETSYFDIVVISALLLITTAMLGRADFLRVQLGEFFALIIIQTGWAIKSGSIAFDSLNISRIILHCITEICMYYALDAMIRNNKRIENELTEHEGMEDTERKGIEDFLVNISHELRTPVNVINGLSSIILKKEDRDDIKSIRDAGLRLSNQIEDIQDFSEIQRGDVLLEEDRYMITSVLNDIVSVYNSGESGKNLELVIDLDPTVPSVMHGDAGKISKIIKHLLFNAHKFTKQGGICLRITGIKREYGINLMIEVSDTGVGMTQSDIEKVSKGIYQANSTRSRSTGGIGLGLSIVYGFARLMKGFVSIESKKNKGTTVRVCIAQEVIDPAPCLYVTNENFINIAFHVIPEKYKVAALREYYKTMAANMAVGLRQNLYSAPTLNELKKLLERGYITHIFMGMEEYLADPDYFDELSMRDIVVAVSAPEGFPVGEGSRVVVMPKPLYGYPVTKVLNGDLTNVSDLSSDEDRKPVLDGVRALVVDDEPMNLVVATGLFREYNMIIDTADSGKQAIKKFEENDYDIVFMDHMMPEMDGVETMRRLREIAVSSGKIARVVALTANAISGAKEMFLREGFDGFISKPININDFERTMSRVLPSAGNITEGGPV